VLEGIAGLLLISVLMSTVIGVIVLVIVYIAKESVSFDFSDLARRTTVCQRIGGEASTPITQTSQLRRMLEATSILGVWMVVGFVLKLEANTYLLLGVPITVGFQLLVRKQPLRAMWVRSAPRLDIARLNVSAKLVGLVFAGANLVFLCEYYLTSHSLIFVLYELVAICGTIPLAYAFHNFTKQMIRPLLMCLATTGTVVVGFDTVAYLLRVFELHTAPPVTVDGFLYVWVVSMAQYLPVVFLLEEGWFRGVFDSHIYHLGEKQPNLTALYVSLLWGAWHFPIVYTPAVGLVGGITILVVLMVFQGLVGYFLSIYWRRTGNLLVPGSVHAFVDSVRNGLGLL
jgi:hypothetical protein